MLPRLGTQDRLLIPCERGTLVSQELATCAETPYKLQQRHHVGLEGVENRVRQFCEQFKGAIWVQQLVVRDRGDLF